MITFPSKIAIDELDIRAKEWKLLGLEPSWTAAGNLSVILGGSKDTKLARYRATKSCYRLVWRLSKRKLSRLLQQQL